ncbi:hypothetical protein R5R35_008118 [Gryllus longicercus]|uniref:Uncharacterized protein n=1 Tax=Gryllus longicercus TaxID=2509291 RepID=A0AAN9V3F9_9ORTH
MSKSSENFGHPAWVRQREFRQRLPLRHSDAFYKRLYSSISLCDSFNRPGCAVPGGIYSMDFSPDGSLLIATCDRSSINVFDPLCRTLIETVSNAQIEHTKVKFLDSRTFATENNDMTVALWDIRNLSEQMRTLRGHSNIVYDIEFSSKNDVLVTCGGDGMIHTWSLKDFTQEIIECKKVFGSHDFLRMRLNPDASKMIISSSRGYLLIVHDLDLNTLTEDLAGYYPGGCPFYHLREMVPCSAVFSRRRRRNRVEPVADFPLADGSLAVSALEIHPQGLSALSRCASEERGLQWLCVHDIRGRKPPEEEEVAMGWRGATSPEPRGRDEQREGGARRTMPFLGSIATSSLHSGESSREEFQRTGEGGGRRDLQVTEAAPASSPGEIGSHAIPKGQVSPSISRLTHYSETHSSEIWYNEELCFSPDGRLLCTPFSTGIKLHTFSPQCFGQFISWPGGSPIPLHEFATYISHESVVISTKFSPRHCLIASGCLRGKINWYQPGL